MGGVGSIITMTGSAASQGAYPVGHCLRAWHGYNPFWLMRPGIFFAPSWSVTPTAWGWWFILTPSVGKKNRCRPMPPALRHYWNSSTSRSALTVFFTRITAGMPVLFLQKRSAAPPPAPATVPASSETPPARPTASEAPQPPAVPLAFLFPGSLT